MVKRSKKGIFHSKGLYIFLILAALIFSITTLLTLKSTPKPSSVTGLEVDPVNGTLLYQVPAKANLKSLAKDLESKGLITNALLFKYFLVLSRQDKKIRAGYFYIKPSNSIVDLAWKLTSGKMATQTITIPEGKTSWEIYAILMAKFPLDSLKFDSLIHSPEFTQYCKINAANLEGYLFPDTYVLPWKVTERDVIAVMVGRFREVIKEFKTDGPVYRQYGPRGWLTLASIVEKEAAVASEQDLIAGVFYNRLRLGWSLGADPTVRFAVRKPTGPLYVSDLDNDSPYNTRKFTGLPPGPICNPGRGALRAALNPLVTDKMFFVAKDDGSREHFFSVNNTDHLHYKTIAAANRLKRGSIRLKGQSQSEMSKKESLNR
jgi:UPF0755 protein